MDETPVSLEAEEEVLGSLAKHAKQLCLTTDPMKRIAASLWEHKLQKAQSALAERRQQAMAANHNAAAVAQKEAA